MIIFYIIVILFLLYIVIKKHKRKHAHQGGKTFNVFEHLSNKEIATRLSISEKTVETQIYRSLQFLREKLSSDVFLACFLIFLANRL